MIPRDCKRLAEVDFPIAEVSEFAVRERSIRRGHPSTLHLWWARRPLAACRAMLLALLLPDPADPLCPKDFKDRLREILRPVPGMASSEIDVGLRTNLLTFISQFANWDLSNNDTYLTVARSLVRAAHGSEPPLVVDPFAGGGSIPFEATRLGSDVFASDLNPVACLILRTMLVDIPRHSESLLQQLNDAIVAIRLALQRSLEAYYPLDPDGSRPIAYLWARTVQCESPNCGAEIPLMRSFWLSKRASNRKALRYTPVSDASSPPYLSFEIFTPRTSAEVATGTVTNAKALCPCCGAVLSRERVRSQLRIVKGGADPIFDDNGKRVGGARLMAVVTTRAGLGGRVYRVPTDEDYRVVRSAGSVLQRLDAKDLSRDISAVPDEPIIQARVAKNSPFRFHLYGCDNFGDVSTSRQKLTLATAAQQVRTAARMSPSISPCLSIIVSRLANSNTSLCRWHTGGEKVEGMFSRQAISMVWDFCESAPFSDASGGFDGAAKWVTDFVEHTLKARMTLGQVQQADAAKSPLTTHSAAVWFTDPPYYDAVSYADLSDFFFAWLKRTHPNPASLADPSDDTNVLTPKGAEAVQDETKLVNGRPKDRAFFEQAMSNAFAEGHRVTSDDGIACVVFAHKTTEGWEALLSGITKGGWVITASWPIATEMKTRLRAHDSAALATSVHLVCRPRRGNEIGDWGELLRELPRRVADWMARLEREGVHGADLVFACIGPALEIFSRYSRVETPDGREVELSEYLEKVWEVVGRSALEQVLGTAEARARNGGLGALEEDSRLTALFLWTLGASSRGGEAAAEDSESEEAIDDDTDDDVEDGSSKKPKGLTLIYDIVRRFAQPLGIHLDAWEKRIIETEKGVVRLLPVGERALQLFGEAGPDAMASAIENDPRKAAQLELFPVMESDAPRIKGRGRKKATATAATAYTGQVTTLDRVHAAMLLQRQGRTNALRSLLAAEAQRGPDFRRLANALSALYPQASEEKRILDAMLLAMPRL